MGRQTITENAIVKAFFTLLETKPFADITVLDVAKEAGVSRATFYRYKKDLLSIFDDVISKDLTTLEESITESNFHEKIKELLQFLYSRRKVILHISSATLNNNYAFNILQFFRRLSLKYVEIKSDIREDLKAKEAERITYEMFGRFVDWVLSGMNEDMSHSFNP